MIGIDQHRDYHFGYPNWIFEPYEFFFIKSTVDVTIHALHIWASTNQICDRLNQLSMEF